MKINPYAWVLWAMNVLIGIAYTVELVQLAGGVDSSPAGFPRGSDAELSSCSGGYFLAPCARA
ncbi:MAG: hypothetical protein MI749_02165 [Desulfovibrionales bacterium]|nr:hypothetical protein [Desulfovibrionales bacterium]